MKMNFYAACFISIALGLSPNPGFTNDAILTLENRTIAIDRTEVTIGAFAVFAKSTGFISYAQKMGGGWVYSSGWEQKSGWTWLTPFGRKSHPDEPVVHVTFDEAAQYCSWAGKRLPTDAEWIAAAYTEQRLDPPKPFLQGKTYLYPTGDTPSGANCLKDCGSTPAIDYSSVLTRGVGPARVGTTLIGVNGLYDMGANVWEWVDVANESQKGTRGGSWWYGAPQMQSTYQASKPRDMAAIYIGFRCVVDID
jgi:formylglycine-generating enzyme